MTGKFGEQKPINKIPTAQRKFATKASRREQRKNNTAETNTTRKPGISRGSSINPLCRLLIAKVSLRKLLKVESTRLWENPKTKVAAKNSRKSQGKLNNLFLIF